MTTSQLLLSLLRRYVSELDARRYSTAHRTLTELADLSRTLPAWLEINDVEPAAEIERALKCGASLTLRNEDSSVVLVVRDDETCTAVAMTEDEANQMLGDVQRVMSAGKEKAA